jgi:hypothetical protein
MKSKFRFAPLFSLAGSLLALASAPAARALEVFNYSATTHERFSSGFPGSPVANTSFLYNGYNLSGIGWSTGNFGVTLVSPRHFLTAAHVGIGAGATVSFLGTDGVVRSYTVDSTTVIQHSAGVNSDLMIGRLTAPISGSDNITHYSTLLLGTGAEYHGLSVAAFGSGGRAGTNTVDIAGNIDILPFGAPNGVIDNTVFITDYDSVTGQTQGQGGDSGSPTFFPVNGALALIGTHSAVDNGSTPVRTFDVLVPAYYNAINTQLAADGYTFGAITAIPEPATWATLAGAAGLALAVIRRRR